MPLPVPSRWEVWEVAEDPDREGELPLAVIMSSDEVNHGPSKFVTVLGVTTRYVGLSCHVASRPVDDFPHKSYIECDLIYTIAKSWLVKRHGGLSADTRRDIDFWVRLLLGFDESR